MDTTLSRGERAMEGAIEGAMEMEMEMETEMGPVMPQPEMEGEQKREGSASRASLRVAMAVAAAGSAGSLYLSLGMKLKACPLCFYQRTFVLAALAVLLLARVVLPGRAGAACLLALPIAAAGLGVAVFHERLVISGALECPGGLLGWGTAPAQSLAVLGLLTAACLAGSIAGRRESARQGAASAASALALALGLGLAMAWASIASAPPLPPPPAKAYDPATQPLDMCRPPFRGERA